MKDAYSFDLDVAGMDRSYQAMYDAYIRIFKRCGVAARPVEADPGLIGGDVSHEFSVLAPAGEDEVVVCPKCGYAANKEKAECRPRASGKPGMETAELIPMETRETPGQHTVEQVATFLGVRPRDVVKTILFQSKEGPLAVLVRGDHEVNPMKLARVVKSSQLEMASPELIQKVTGGPIGFSGPVGLRDVRVVADHAISGMTNFVTGANAKDKHHLNVNLSRDFRPETFADVRFALAGDPCPRCGEALEFHTGIEVGHVFKLGTKYSGKMHCDFLDEKGQRKPMIMGCYGIGVTRVVAAAIEQNHDDGGIVWPRELAPYAVELVTINQKDEKIQQAGQQVHDALEAAGLEVLWDDREATPGVKFADADLIGIPLRLTVGKRTIESGTVDLQRRKDRKEKTQQSVPVNDVVKAVKEAWNAL
jgi:prolyl-tRNA synthetase